MFFVEQRFKRHRIRTCFCNPRVVQFREMRSVAVTIALVVVCVPAALAHATRTAIPIVHCADSILTVKSGTQGGYRVVLGVVSVPPARLTQVVRTDSKRWPFWRKAGLVIRAGNKTVTVSVPEAWRRRAAVGWGNSGVVSTLKFAPCPTPKPWNAYAGGFHLRTQRECVPLVFRVGNRAARVRFGLGGACASR